MIEKDENKTFSKKIWLSVFLLISQKYYKRYWRNIKYKRSWFFMICYNMCNKIFKKIFFYFPHHLDKMKTQIA